MRLHIHLYSQQTLGSFHTQSQPHSYINIHFKQTIHSIIRNPARCPSRAAVNLGSTYLTVCIINLAQLLAVAVIVDWTPVQVVCFCSSCYSCIFFSGYDHSRCNCIVICLKLVNVNGVGLSLCCYLNKTICLWLLLHNSNYILDWLPGFRLRPTPRLYQKKKKKILYLS